MTTDFLISIDGEVISFNEFYVDNTAPDVEPIADEDMNTIRNLAVGEEHLIPAHAGWTSIKRVS